MPSTFSKTLRYIFLACFLFAGGSASAQKNYHNILFKIDSLIDVGLPKSALAEVDILDALARKEDNTSQTIRAVLYRLKLQTYLEDDALVNVINTLRVDIDGAGYPVKPILQSFLADMYWSYYQQNRYKFANRTRLEKHDVDFRDWDLASLINETTRLYNLSLQDAEKEQQTPVDILDGILTGEKNFRYLRPTLYDMLSHRAFEYFLADEPAITRPKMPFTLNDTRFFGDSKKFIQLPVTTTDTNSTWYRGIKFLQQGIAFHLKANNPKALANLDMQRLNFIYDNSNISNKDTLYITALKGIAADSSAGNLRADALYTIASHYNSELANGTMAMVYLKQAIANYPKSFGAINSSNLMKDILQKKLEATLEDINSPDKPILSLLEYCNITAARYRIYRLTSAQLALLGKMDKHDGDILPGNQTEAYLKKLNPVQDKVLELPGTNDYNTHKTEFKIDALAKGTYVLLLQQATTRDSLMQLTNFRVSGLAYLARTLPHGSREIRVVNRETGAPVKGAAVTAVYIGDRYSQAKTKPIMVKGLTDARGALIFTVPGNYIDIDVHYSGDQVHSKEKSIYSATLSYRDTITPKPRTLFFTDRQIYRPGQTIYFKTLQVQTLNGKSSIVPNASLEVKMKDMNSRQLASAKLITNDFGSAASSFTLPQNIINGSVYLFTETGSITVTVSEYKRPTFSTLFEPSTKNYKLNDSVIVKGTVTAFSGYGLSEARIAYRVTRSRDMGIPYSHRGLKKNYYSRGTDEIATDTIKTDEQGKFELTFLAIPGEENEPDISYLFNIAADVTDANGETQNAGTSLSLSNKPIQLEFALPDMAMPKTAIDATLMLFNSGHQRKNGQATVVVYALKSPGEFFKTRLTANPDKWLLSREDYHKNFPGFAYKGEDDYKNWERLQKTQSFEFDLKDTDAGRVDLSKLFNSPVGVYAVVVNAKNESGDTTSVIKYINIIKEEAPIQKNENWVLPISTTVQPGQPAEFFVGINKSCSVLLETYDEDKLLSSRLVALSPGPPQKISIPVPATKRNTFTVQFVMINGNRIYKYYERVLVADTIKPLNIRFLTMRNKLQPGDKEQWKLEITGSEGKQASELLAGMYDASLDDITPPASWRYLLATTGINGCFEWRSEPISATVNTMNEYESPDYDRTNTDIKYETIDMLGFNYFGYYNDNYENFRQAVSELHLSTLSDKKIAAKYARNATLVNNGYDVVGKVLGNRSGLAGVTVRINNSNISTVSNSLGYFKIKVPVNAILVFSAKDWATKRLNPPKGIKLIVQMKSLAQVLYERELMLADPGVKSQKGDPNADIRINEPVGNSDVTQVVEENSLGFFNNAQVSGYLAFAPPVIKADKEPAMMYDELYDPKLRQKVAAFKTALTNRKPITIRKNFNETAFFYPQLRTDAKGQVTISFTIPEALTKWKFRGVAYNQKLQTGYIEQLVITQKQVSISANMPRFLREEDTLVVSARVVNLSPGNLKGEAQLLLFNALTMQPVNLFAKGDNGTQRFSVDSATTKTVSFKLIIPAGLEALTYRLTANAGDYTDGEENTLPVLPNRMPVTETMPLMVRAGQTKTFSFDKLINQSSNTLQNKTLTLEYTQNPAWAAVQALPYMMEFPYGCSEQIFSRFYANSFAAYIVNSNPKIKQVLERWKATDSKELLSNLEKNAELKSVLLEETPWLQDAANETEQRKRIAQLFDLNKTSYELNENLLKLQKKQLSNGAFPWFGGTYADRYITQHIVAGIGQLNKTGITGEAAPTLQGIGNRALAYLAKQLVEDEAERKKYDKKYQSRNLDNIEIHAWYAYSYFKETKVAGELKEVRKNYLARAAAQWTSRSEYEKAMIALTLYRMGDKDATAAIIKSLKETARQSDELGMYWAANTYGYYWYESPVETQSLIIELFTEATNDPAAVAEMKIWLLRNKQTNNWRTTKATAAACYALLIKSGNVLSDTAKVNISIGGKPLAQLKPEIKAEVGTGYLKTTWVDEQIKPSFGNVRVANMDKTINWGALYWQYTEKLDKVTPSNTNVQMKRKYYIKKQTDSGPMLVAVDATHLPKTGEVLKVVLHLKADRDFDYIHLKDMRPAGTEPINSLSEYKYQDGLYYYQATKDVATNFFISRLNKGTYVFEYELRVVQPGNYATGITSLQSMYSPEFNAHSDGGRITFMPQN
ncbi:alpha-2-macroglobulin family protein [Mucilaginibacter sp.]|uniref:alpha-2-macroglobulin family protein n=1 Tax=Mucilaginibacter sp. TaxID=1882438 RepID=UPI003266EADC